MDGRCLDPKGVPKYNDIQELLALGEGTDSHPKLLAVTRGTRKGSMGWFVAIGVGFFKFFSQNSPHDFSSNIFLAQI